MSKARAYYRLAKPGIVYGNSLTTAAGYLFASNGKVDPVTLLAVLAGTALVIACGCVINNYIDREIDAKMSRTKLRALVTDAITAPAAIVYGLILGVAGFVILLAWTNTLTAALGLTGLFFYLVMYSFFKRRSVHGTLIGSVSGATPILAGYTAVTGQLNTTGLLLFLTMACWQMPHFYAIAIFRYKDYKAAGLPVLSVKNGIAAAKIQIMAYIVAFLGFIYLLAVVGHAGYIFLIVMVLLTLRWLYLGWKGFGTDQDQKWGRQMFGFSLVVMMALCFMLAVAPLLR